MNSIFDIMCMNELSNGAKALFVRLCAYENYYTKICPTVEKLGAELNKTRKTISLYLGELESLNIISIDIVSIQTNNKYQTRNIYTLHHENVPHIDIEDNSTKCTEVKKTTKTITKKTKLNLIDGVPYTEIIDYLNEIGDKRFKSDTREYIADVNKLWEEGYILEDFKYVIKNKCTEWLDPNAAEMCKRWVRPSTLFRYGNFINYINEPEYIIKNNSYKNKKQNTESYMIPMTPEQHAQNFPPRHTDLTLTLEQEKRMEERSAYYKSIGKDENIF